MKRLLTDKICAEVFLDINILYLNFFDAQKMYHIFKSKTKESLSFHCGRAIRIRGVPDLYFENF